MNLARIVSKLSPLVGNLIEFNAVEYLNAKPEFTPAGRWRRQDPGFPDTIFEGQITPVPGIEMKAWFPLATEITARFKDSQTHFSKDQTSVCLLAWLPESLIFGCPRVIDVCIVSAKSVAAARDRHYHRPPDYLVVEPEDTTDRTRNLWQTNTNGYKFQGGAEQLLEAQKIVKRWGPGKLAPDPRPQYQALVRELLSKFSYRLDTNYAKIDRIEHAGIEEFKARVLATEFCGMAIREWSRRIGAATEALRDGEEEVLYEARIAAASARLEKALADHLKITKAPAENLIR